MSLLSCTLVHIKLVVYGTKYFTGKGISLPNTSTLKIFEGRSVSDPLILNILFNVEVSFYLILYALHLHQLKNLDQLRIPQTLYYD